MNKRLNIVFIPPEKISSAAIDLCKQIENLYKVSFSLDGVTNHPHITIYQLIVSEDSLQKLTHILERIAQLATSQEFVFKNFQQHFGFLGASFEPTNQIKTFQQLVVEKTEAFRSKDIIQLDNSIIQQYPQKQQEIIRKFGFDNLLDFYNPHITITQLSDFKTAEKLTNELSWEAGSFCSNSLGLYELGDFGTCNKLIKKFKLAGGD